MQNMITLYRPGVNINTLYCCWNAGHAPASQDKDISDNYPAAAAPGQDTSTLLLLAITAVPGLTSLELETKVKRR